MFAKGVLQKKKKKKVKKVHPHTNTSVTGGSVCRHTLKCVKALIKHIDSKILKNRAVMCSVACYLCLREGKVMWNDFFFYLWAQTQSRVNVLSSRTNKVRQKVVSRSKQQINKQIFKRAFDVPQPQTIMFCHSYYQNASFPLNINMPD